jgi:hypothetical protein
MVTSRVECRGTNAIVRRPRWPTPNAWRFDPGAHGPQGRRHFRQAEAVQARLDQTLERQINLQKGLLLSVENELQEVP